MTDHLNELIDYRARLIRALADADSNRVWLAISRTIDRLNDAIEAIEAILRGQS